MMSKVKKSAKVSATTPHVYAMPAAPWIYIDDITPDGYITAELAKLIPVTTIWNTISQRDCPTVQPVDKFVTPNKSGIKIIRDLQADNLPSDKKATIRVLRAHAMKVGANFVTIHVRDGPSDVSDSHVFGTVNHLNVDALPGAGETIVDWLFTTLTIRETLYLIPDADMKKIDTKLFPQYEYCPINESRNRPKDAKVQFVALVLTKPQVIEGNKLVWTVADKTGVANFFFQHRGGPHSQYTWDWVMSLKPGDRKALPRMPMVQLKERKSITVIKAPLRAAAATMTGTGIVLKQIGRGFSKLGNSLKLGSSSEWVLAADVDANGKKVDRLRVQKDTVKVERKTVDKDAGRIDEKNEQAWDDGASIASTEAGSEASQEKIKELL